MNHHTRTRLATIAAVLFLVAATAGAQLPSASTYVVAGRASSGPALLMLDAAGKMTSLVPLAGAVNPVSVAMSVRNDAVVAWDHGQLHTYDVANGACTRTTVSAFNRVSSAFVDEDGGMVWCTNTGTLYKSSDTGCTALITVAILANHSFQAVGLEGSTGRWILGTWDGIAADWQILYTDINGRIQQKITGMPSITGLSWSPRSNSMFGSYDSNGGGVVRIDGTGSVTTLALPASAARTSLMGLEVYHQPREQMLCVEGGASPQHLVLVAPDGTLTTVHSSSGIIDPVGCSVLRNRALWATSKWSLDKPGYLSVNFGPAQAGRNYVVALSFGYRPGIAIPGVGTIHLYPDSLFYLSLTAGPPLFDGFAGVLDAKGRCNVDPFLAVPDDWGLLGVRVYGSAIAYDKTGVTAISNAWGINIGYT